MSRRIITILCTVAAVSAMAGRARGGSLEASPRALDFGDRGHGESIPLKVTLKNTGRVPIRVTAIRPSCGCTTVTPNRIADVIRAGASVELTVTMSSGRAMGLLDKYITIETNRPEDSLKIATRMTVFTGVEIKPAQLHLDGEVGGKKFEGFIDVLFRSQTREKRGLEIHGVFSDAGRSAAKKAAAGTEGAANAKEGNPHFETRLEEIPGGRRVHVAVLPTLPEGRFAAMVRTTLDGKPFHIALSGEMFRGIKQSPAQFNFNRVEVEKPESLVSESVLGAIDGQAFRIVKMQASVQRSPLPGLDVQMTSETEDGGKTHRLKATLALPAGARAKGSFSGKVEVETDHPEKPKLTYSFFGFFP